MCRRLALLVLSLSCCAVLRSFAREVPYRGEQRIQTDDVKITLPRKIDLWCGYREDIPLNIENKSSHSREIVIRVKTEVNIFVNGLTSRIGSEETPIEVARVKLSGRQTQTENLEIQSLRVGHYRLKVIVAGEEASLEVSSKVIERGAYFMYRCWYEGAEFFYPAFSDGSREVTPREVKQEERDLVRIRLRSGATKAAAQREASRIIYDKYKFVGYKQRPDWESAYARKKDQHTELYGFQYIDIDGLGWNEVERRRGQYDWSVGDFLLDLNAKYFFGVPFVRLEVFPQWTKFSQGPSGIWGFYDPRNDTLLQHWEDYCAALAERYDGDGRDDAPGAPVVEHFILTNEPAGAWFHVNFSPDGWPVRAGGETALVSTNWWREAVRQGGREAGAEAYVQHFGEMLFATIKRAAQAIHRANPRARVGTPQFIAAFGPNDHMFRYLLDQGIGEYVDAWGIHPANAFRKLWKSNPAVAYVVEDAANQAPPFESRELDRTCGALDRKGEILETVEPVAEIRRDNPYMGKLWRKLVDETFSRQLEDPNKLLSSYGLDLPFWATEEITIGPLATNRRENLIAALREYTIVFHQKVEITTLASVIAADSYIAGTDRRVNYLPDSTARQLIIGLERAIAGAQPVEKFDCRWFVPGEGKYLDYRWTVYKLFNRGDEDIMALWSNSAKDEALEFTLNPAARIRDVHMVKYDAGAEPFRTQSKPGKFPAELRIKPLQEFYFLSVKSDRPRFGWLLNLRRRVSRRESELTALLEDTEAQLQKTVAVLRQRRERTEAAEFHRISRLLEQAEDELIMGNYEESGNMLQEIRDALAKLN